MHEPRPAASLTSNLLARRGDARPAMRRQAISHLHLPVTPQDDLGWNDIGDESEQTPPATSLAAMTPPSPSADDGRSSADAGSDQAALDQDSPMARQIESIEERLSEPAVRLTNFKPVIARSEGKAPAAPRTPRAEPGTTGRKAAFTLRLDADRHLRLRLLSALVHRSSQQLLIEALDELLARHAKVEDLAGQVGEAGGANEA